MTNKFIKKRQSNACTDGIKEEEFIKNLLLNNSNINNKYNIYRKYKHDDLLIKYGNKKYPIDSDIVLENKNNGLIEYVISVKKSFRERGSQSSYWALKCHLAQKKYKYILATPDNDNELFKLNDPEKINKWRHILPFEHDAVFIIGNDKNNKIYKDKNNKFFVGNEYLLEYINLTI